MTIPENKIYPRTGDKETIYLKNVIKNPNIVQPTCNISFTNLFFTIIFLVAYNPTRKPTTSVAV